MRVGALAHLPLDLRLNCQAASAGTTWPASATRCKQRDSVGERHERTHPVVRLGPAVYLEHGVHSQPAMRRAR